MKRIAMLAVVLAASTTPAWAQISYAGYTASIEFEDGLPQFRIGDAAAEPGAQPGTWTTPGVSSAGSSVREQVGVQVDPATGQSTPVWGPARSGETHFTPPTTPYTLPGATVSSSGFVPQGWGYGNVNPLSLETGGFFRIADGAGPGATTSSTAFWSRSFLLDADASVTFNALGRFSGPDSLGPIDVNGQVNFIDAASFAFLEVSDIGRQVNAMFGVQIDNSFASSLRDLVSLSYSDDGLMSMTIRNTTGGVLGGVFQAGTRVDASMPWTSVAAPVPEPGALALMLAGAGVLGAVGRRRAARPAGETTAVPA